MANRPTSLGAYVGQEHIKPLLSRAMASARTTGKPLPHTLLYGPGGLGKTSLAAVVALEMGYKFLPTVAGQSLTASSLQNWFLRLPTAGYDKNGNRQPGGPVYLIFIDEVHLLKEFECLYEALEDCQISHRGAVSWLPDFCLIAATTEMHALPKPFQSRFTLQLPLKPYDKGHLVEMIRNNNDYGTEAAWEIAARSRGTARTALNHAEAAAVFGTNADAVREYFATLGIDEHGFTDLDRQYLALLESGPMSVQSLASVLRVDTRTVQKQIEPYLLESGRVVITGKGRELAQPGRGRKGG